VPDESGSAVLEGMAAMAVLFLLLVLIAQAAFLVVARSTGAAATAAAARRAALPEAEAGAELDRLTAEVTAAIPGAIDPTASAVVSAESVEITLTFRWAPPGPDLLPITIRSTSRASKVVPP
jgi:hypothetical protein